MAPAAAVHPAVLAGRKALVMDASGGGGAARSGAVRGATAGVGEAGPGPAAAVAGALAAHGAAVAVAGDTGRPGAAAAALPLDAPGTVAAAARRAAGHGVSALALHCDPGSDAAYRTAVAHTALEFGGVDLLAVCALPGRAVRPTAVRRLVGAAAGFLDTGAAVLLVDTAPAAHGAADLLAEWLFRQGLAVVRCGPEPSAVARAAAAAAAQATRAAGAVPAARAERAGTRPVPHA